MFEEFDGGEVTALARCWSMKVMLSGRIAVGWVEWCRGIYGVGSESGDVGDEASSGLSEECKGDVCSGQRYGVGRRIRHRGDWDDEFDSVALH